MLPAWCRLHLLHGLTAACLRLCLTVCLCLFECLFVGIQHILHKQLPTFFGYGVEHILVLLVALRIRVGIRRHIDKHSFVVFKHTDSVNRKRTDIGTGKCLELFVFITKELVNPDGDFRERVCIGICLNACVLCLLGRFRFFHRRSRLTGSFLGSHS